jgi:hypothetical protein
VHELGHIDGEFILATANASGFNKAAHGESIIYAVLGGRERWPWSVLRPYALYALPYARRDAAQQWRIGWIAEALAIMP